MNLVKTLFIGVLVLATSGCFNTRDVTVKAQTESIYAFMLSDNAIHALGAHYDYQIHTSNTQNAKALIQLLHSPYYPFINKIELSEIKKNVKGNIAETCLKINFELTKFTDNQKQDLRQNYQVNVASKNIYYHTCLQNIALVKVENREQLLAKNKFSPPLQTRLIEYKEDTYYSAKATEMGIAVAIVAPIFIAGAIIALPFTLFSQD
ncbi:hypothetical protein [Pasteurella multocida]|uniref:hypothetical protein n=1 Tax=Pasteurella multocida TaxID=747 RepID=UPI0024468BB1|nr:hypothetical protein [Pasteurella multocida]MDH3002958.1 hypothetical protein [Pasteurella multocida]